MDPIQTGLTGVLLPAVLSGLLLAVGWRVWKRDAEGVDGRWSGSLALAAAFLATYLAIAGAPSGILPGSDRTPTGLDWLFVLAAGAAVLFAHPDPVLWRRLGVRLAVSGLTVWLVLKNAFANQLAGDAAIAWFLGLAALLLIVWTAADLRARRRSGASSPLVWWATAATLAGVAGLSGSLKLAQLSGAVAAALGAAVVLAWWRPRLSLAGGGVALASILLFGLGLNAHFFSYTTGLDVLLIAVAPLAPFLRVLPFLNRLEGKKRTLVELALAGIPLAVALARAGLAYEPDPYADYQ